MFRAQQNAFDEAVGKSFPLRQPSQAATDQFNSESDGREFDLGELGVHTGISLSRYLLISSGTKHRRMFVTEWERKTQGEHCAEPIGHGRC